MSEKRFFDKLYKHLDVLSSSYDKQIVYLDSLGNVHVDELGLELDDSWIPVKHIVETDEAMKNFYEAICELNLAFAPMNGKKDIWTAEALKEKSEWENIRNLANKCLKVFPSQEN